jgi:hypothetical protein
MKNTCMSQNLQNYEEVGERVKKVAEIEGKGWRGG